MKDEGLHVVWLKRDLRIADHAPLLEACKHARVVVLYVYEPEILQSEEHDTSHLEFVNQSLLALDEALQKRGAHLTYRVGPLPQVLEDLRAQHSIAALYSHEETGNHLTYMRDLRVKAWAASHRIPWSETPQNGVVRRLRSRDGWARRWESRMNTPLQKAPDIIRSASDVHAEHPRSARDLGLAPNTKTEAQAGGEPLALATLRTFLETRGLHYRSDMSSPVEGWEGCSRLSPHLAYGTISLRAVYKHTLARQGKLKLALQRERNNEESTAETQAFLNSLTSFQGRLHWHCHFMQKLESQPSIEFENMARAYDGLRENEFHQERFDAWKEGRTGYPMVDACMRALHATGWINFRMRAMLVSFATYDLWLHWRPVAVYLASQFLDFEAGIHFSQVQMQAGTAGINTLRMYNPSKQATDQDPDGVFIRQYVPELRNLPTPHLAEPWTTPPLVQIACGCIIGKTYPAPIVDHLQAVAFAKRRIGAIRQSVEARSEAGAVFQRHGSRRGPRR